MEKLLTHSNFRLRLTIMLLFLTFGVSGQQYQYSFRIHDVTTPAEAKNITDPLRRLFNDSSNPYATFPWFNDTSDEFIFSCPLPVSREKVEQTLTPLGYVLTEFTVTTAGGSSGTQTE